MDARTRCLTITVSVSVPVCGTDVNHLEAEWSEAARTGFAASVRAVQSAYQHEHRDMLERREWRRRHLQTRLGTVSVEMLKVRNREMGVSRMLGMDLFGLAPRQRTTRWVEQRAVEMRVRGPSYRQAVEAVDEMLGTRHSAMWLWRRVQARGRQCIANDRAAMRATEAGTLRAADPPEHLYLEADEIHIAAQRSTSSTHRVKVAIGYTGRNRVEGYRTPRYCLAEKCVYGGIEDLDTFGRGWYAILERRHRISDAPAVLYTTDGDRGLMGLQETHFPHAIRHHDWAHILRDLRAAAPDETRRARWVAQLLSGRYDLLARSLRRCRTHRKGNAQAADRVLRALADADVDGWKRFRRLHDPDRTRRIPRASGAIEKNQEVLIGRTMKKRGMAWTRRGANHLVKLVIASQNHTTWNSLWSEPFPP
jgi:hypothetical protein